MAAPAVQNAVPAPVVGAVTPAVQANTPAEKAPKKENSVSIDPKWVITKTCFGTPVALTEIIRYANEVEFMVLPNYSSNKHLTTAKSEDLMKPENMTEEQAKELENVQWWSPRVKKNVEKDVDTEKAV